jgi:hypothetical protein
MTPEADMQRDIREVLLRDLNRRALVFHPLGGGRNSRVFRVECEDGSMFAAKAYFQSAQDRRDRLGCEFGALQFLKEQGIDVVPTALASDAPRRVGIYEFVAGQPLQAGEIDGVEIDKAVAFLQKLKVLADSGKAGHFPPASEACFSIAAILENLAARFRRLDEAAASQPMLADFLRDELVPGRERVEQLCHAFCREAGISEANEVPVSGRTLSPSDFGFHNALRRADGRLVFLDFEYFGWDDRAKTIVDFLLHPGMELSPELKRRFFTGMTGAFAGVPDLPRRVRVVYPLFALKWCAILLNEFTLEDGARRCFAGGAQGERDGAAQIQKARSMLARATNDDHDLPWHG